MVADANESEMRTFAIRISSTHPDAAKIAYRAAEKIVCEIDWGNDQYSNVEVVETSGGPTAEVFLGGWAMEPGDEEV